MLLSALVGDVGRTPPRSSSPRPPAHAAHVCRAAVPVPTEERRETQSQQEEKKSSLRRRRANGWSVEQPRNVDNTCCNFGQIGKLKE